jgi:hypothetical protein
MVANKLRTAQFSGLAISCLRVCWQHPHSLPLNHKGIEISLSVLETVSFRLCLAGNSKDRRTKRQ